MSKTVTMIRHAKSSWDDVSLADIDRPLNKRGLRNAPEMGQRLKQLGIRFSMVYSSPAKRASATADLISTALGLAPFYVQQVHQLYTFGAQGLLDWLSGLGQQENGFALVVHNPALTDLVNQLSGAELANIPTCGVVVLELQIEHWCELAESTAMMTHYDFPKNKP